MELADLQKANDKARKKAQSRYQYARSIKDGKGKPVFTALEARLLRSYSTSAIDKLAKEKREAK